MLLLRMLQPVALQVYPVVPRLIKQLQAARYPVGKYTLVCTKIRLKANIRSVSPWCLAFVHTPPRDVTYASQRENPPLLDLVDVPSLVGLPGRCGTPQAPGVPLGIHCDTWHSVHLAQMCQRRVACGHASAPFRTGEDLRAGMRRVPHFSVKRRFFDALAAWGYLRTGDAEDVVSKKAKNQWHLGRLLPLQITRSLKKRLSC
jgi:hypothetical protein